MRLRQSGSKVVAEWTAVQTARPWEVKRLRAYNWQMRVIGHHGTHPLHLIFVMGQIQKF